VTQFNHEQHDVSPHNVPAAFESDSLGKGNDIVTWWKGCMRPNSLGTAVLENVNICVTIWTHLSQLLYVLRVSSLSELQHCPLSTLQITTVKNEA